MKASFISPCVTVSLVVLTFILASCDGIKTPVTPDSANSANGIPGQVVRKSDQLPQVLATALPNLRVEGIRNVAGPVQFDGTCSVTFYCRVANRGTATARSFVLAMRGWGTQTIMTCTGTWQATNTTYDLPAGSTREILIYGPGYVGPRLRKGTYLTVTAYADAYCAVPEMSEYDNSLTQTIRAGY